MIVCPNCRTINEEGLETCTSCGRSLAPGPSLLGPSRRTAGEAPPLEIKAPKPVSKWRPWVLLGFVVVLAASFVVWRSAKPDPCRGTNFTSEKFGYCLTVPEGWTAGNAMVGNVAVDQFSLPLRSTTVLVEAVDLAEGTGLRQFGDFVRQRDDQAGLTPGPVSNLRLGGVEAQQWDIELTSATGESFQLREVVVVVGEVGWRITLNDSAESFSANAESFHRMLRSWRFS
ncbi:MAG: hypothetical protein ACT4PO_00260 [Actinomycetota bacterium]